MCYFLSEMEDIIKKAVINEEKGKGGSRKAKLDVCVIPRQQKDIHTIVMGKLKNLDGQYSTFNCTSKKDQEKNYFKFNCLRFGHPKPKSYRSVGCKAYVSFKVSTYWEGYTVIVQRVYDHHTNHSTSDPGDVHSNCMAPELKIKIEELLSLGTKPDIILTECHKWARNQGHSNVHDRMYFVTPRDIDNVRTTVTRRKHFNSNDNQSVECLLTGAMQEHVLFYQPYTSYQELIILLQTPMMKSNLDKYGKQLVFVDTTHCVNQYDFPLLTLLVRDDHGRGVPVAYAIVSNECQNTLEKALAQLRKQFLCPPRAFMVDKDYAEINALSSTFPESAILLCWYHVLQAVERWLSKTDSSVHGPSNVKIRDCIISFFCKLKACKTVAEYKATSEKFCHEFKQYPAVCHYFKRHWEDIGHMWSNYGRCFNHLDSETNNVIERFFHRLKYQFLGGSRNRRIDDLIQVLLGKAEDYFTIIQNLQFAGRIKNKCTFIHCTSPEKNRGFDQSNSDTLYVPLPTTGSTTIGNLITEKSVQSHSDSADVPGPTICSTSTMDNLNTDKLVQSNSDSAGVSVPTMGSSTTELTSVEKLMNVTRIVSCWTNIPNRIEDMIDRLHSHVVQAESQGHINVPYPINVVDRTLKIRPLFPSRKGTMGSGTLSCKAETPAKTVETPDYPLKKRLRSSTFKHKRLRFSKQ
ncbi:uncharacterized protein LOC143139222 isoform X1 [Alosa pseudoharengus]|uniref:uncharacterized protein LOC143105759 isoform X1 n=2 Tax=Alosa pseudoharengus TaxID=34774 RepID=UPI003F8C9632